MAESKRKCRLPHKTVPVRVIVDIDKGIAKFVRYLQTIPGIRTHASCQGTIGEGGPHPYRAEVMVTWENQKALQLLREKFDMTFIAGSRIWAYVHPPWPKEPR